MSLALDFKKYIPTFDEYLLDSNQTWANLKAYKSGREPLKSAVMSHPTGDSMYDFVMANVKRNMWMTARDTFKKIGVDKTKITFQNKD